MTQHSSLLRSPEAAAYLGLTVKALWQWGQKGLGPRIAGHAGGRGNPALYDRRDLDAWRVRYGHRLNPRGRRASSAQKSPWLTTAEAAHLLRLEPAALVGARRRGIGPPVHGGRYRREELLAWAWGAEERAQPPESDRPQSGPSRPTIARPGAFS